MTCQCDFYGTPSQTTISAPIRATISTDSTETTTPTDSTVTTTTTTTTPTTPSPILSEKILSNFF